MRYLQKKYQKKGTMPSKQQQKSHKVSNDNIQRYVSVKFPLIKSAKFQIWTSRFYAGKPRSWILRNNNNFYLNISEWLASPGGTKFSKPIEEMSKEELNVFLKSFCTSARKKDGTSVYERSATKSIWEPTLIVSFALHIRPFVKGLRKTGNIAGVVHKKW